MIVYKYDLHVHTMETSHCGHMFAEDIIDYYYKEGYSGIAITDHFHEEYFSMLPEYESDWEACVRRFLMGYHSAVAHAKVLGMDVLLGIEIRFPESQSDYLIFGIDEAFLYNNPYCYRMGIDAFYKQFGHEVVIIQAHPYRTDKISGERGIVHPYSLHGVEAINCNPRHSNFNELSIALCRKYPHLLRISGSDTHRPVDLCVSYTGFPRQIHDSKELKAALLNRDYQLGFHSNPELAADALR